MVKIPPFVANSPDDMHCVNAVFRMLYQHYFNEDKSWEEIDALSKAIPGKGTWTVLVDADLGKRGIHITQIEPVDYRILYKKGPLYLKEIYGEQMASYYLTRSNVTSIIPYIPEFLKYVDHQTRRSNTNEVIDNLTRGKLVACEVNSAVLNKFPGFNVHFVLLYDFDGSYLYMHDPGLPPMPSRKIPVEDFRKSFEHPGGSWAAHIYSAR